MAPSSLAQWFAAGGTIGAVILALFGNFFLRWYRRPRLAATWEDNPPWTPKVPWVEPGWAGDRYWVRIRVKNSGKTRAEKVEVYASKLSERGADGKFVPIPTFLPLDMKWSHSDALVIRDGISPDMATFCDIVALCDPANPNPRFQRQQPAATPPINLAELQLEAFTTCNLLSPGTYQLTLRIAAANAKPIDKTLEFTHTGSRLTVAPSRKG
jgi:hypothetical protein